MRLIKKASSAPYVTPYAANAVKLNGSSDYLARGAALTGVSDSSQGILSFWFRPDSSSPGGAVLLKESGGYFSVVYNGTGASAYIRTTLLNSTGAYDTFLDTSAIDASSSTWHHVLMSWDTNYSSGNKLYHIYVDDVSSGTKNGDNDPAYNVYLSAADWFISYATFFNGGLCEVYFAPGQFLDFSVIANRRKFNNGSNKPVDLGADGSTPTGTAPILYLKNDYTSFGTNSGTGGNLTVYGSPTSTTPP